MNKYYQTTFTVVVLSQEPLGDPTLSQLEEATMDGDCVMQSIESKETKLTSKQVVKALYDAGSEPGFFGLDDKGNEID
jgi:hypothetical protein